MTDLSALSDSDLMAMIGGDSGSSASSLSDSELMGLIGGNTSQPATPTG